MEWISWAIDFLRQLTSPEQLNQMASAMGWWLDVVLFGIIFCETGLVILPFLPGDSLLFAVGAVGSLPGSTLNLPVLSVLLIIAAVVGDAVNYAIGKRIGPKIFASETSRLLNKKHLQEAHNFYEKYGAKTIILARFVPIIRTFAPFVAGIGKMSYPKFAMYNVTGAILWVGLLVLAGRLFAGFEFVQKHFESVIVAIIVISVLPAVIEFLRAKYGKKPVAQKVTAEPAETEAR
jgi:membrane-associated protein